MRFLIFLWLKFKEISLGILEVAAFFAVIITLGFIVYYLFAIPGWLYHLSTPQMESLGDHQAVTFVGLMIIGLAIFIMWIMYHAVTAFCEWIRSNWEEAGIIAHNRKTMMGAKTYYEEIQKACKKANDLKQ